MVHSQLADLLAPVRVSWLFLFLPRCFSEVLFWCPGRCFFRSPGTSSSRHKLKQVHRRLKRWKAACIYCKWGAQNDFLPLLGTKMLFQDVPGERAGHLDAFWILWRFSPKGWRYFFFLSIGLLIDLFVLLLFWRFLEFQVGLFLAPHCSWRSCATCGILAPVWNGQQLAGKGRQRPRSQRVFVSALHSFWGLAELLQVATWHVQLLIARK